ncbi:hypothetical protein QBC46DRAFT_444851 [Diplogelasinospora grovesii]|uniref:Uncharacterized protein n=1 Tax=Diplogelasinospora grovesii TaxID=303347 RepID=A0AAN6SAH7_9PEZI|nr:hypothetical protein QBC46DRAFT_444851 [Diplogelasinospora grovesii]
MASLPKDHPSLAIHLCDRALAPILSSGPPPPPSSTRTAARTTNPTVKQSSAPSQHQPQSSPSNGSNSDISSVNLDDNHPSQSSSLRQSSPRQNAAALRSLASTALTAHSVASRLEAGYPMRIMVEFGGRGPVVLSSFLDADSIASLPPPPPPQPLPPSSISTTSQFPNGQQPSPPPPPRTGSSPAKPTITAGVPMSTVIAAVGLPESSSTTPPIPSTPTRTSMPTPTIHTPTTHTPAPVPTSKHTGSTQTATHKRTDSRTDMSKDTSRGRTRTRVAGGGNTAEGYQSDGSASSEQPPPMLVGVVVAPDAEHAVEARRAANKLEHLGRRFQLAWIEEYQNPQPQETPT